MKKTICLMLSMIMLMGVMACGKKPATDDFKIDPNKEGELTMEQFAAPTRDEQFYTGYQMAHPYNSTMDVPTESVWVYGWLGPENPSDMVKTYLNRGYKDIGLMFSVSRDFYDNDYTSSHPEIIQTKSNGSQRRHNNIGGFQVYPNEAFVKYVADKVKPLIDMGVTSLHLEEPDGYADSYNNQFFKDSWKIKYGVDYVEPNEDDPSAEFTFKKDTLIADIFVNAYKTFIEYIKKDYPNIHIFNATHTMIDYAGNHRISSNNAAYLDLDGMDGTVIQAWSNTSETPVYYKGDTIKMPFENGYIQYNEGGNYLRGKENKRVFSLADASADGNPTPSEAYTRTLYQDNIVAQLMMPTIYSYESTVWPDRAFAPMSMGYKAVQEGVIQLQKDIHNYPTTKYGGNQGIGVVMSYNGVSSISNPTASIQALSLPLLKDGASVEILTLETLTSVEALKGINVLVLSYDFIKPEYQKYNDTIIEWVKAGGSLLYVGGKNYQQTMSHWWSQAGYNSPEAHLFDKLGVTVSGVEYSNNFMDKISKVNDAPVYFSDVSLLNSFNVSAYTIGGNAKPLFKIGNETIAFEQKCDKGSVVVVGCEPELLSSNDDGIAFYKMLYKRALELKGEHYYAPKMIYAVRGNYEMYHAFDTEKQLEGTFINLFSDTYEILENPKLTSNTSMLLYRISDNASGLLFTSGTVQNYNEQNYTFKVKNTHNSRMQAVIKIPDGFTKMSVVVKDSNSGISRNDVTTTTLSNSLVLISYDQKNTSTFLVELKFS